MSIYKQNAISRKYLSHTQLFVTGATSRYALTARHLPPNPSPNPPRICPHKRLISTRQSTPYLGYWYTSDTGDKNTTPAYTLPISLQIMT